MDSLALLRRGPGKGAQPLYVLHGDEPFLKRQVLGLLREHFLGSESDETAVAVHAGDKAQFAQVWDELETVPFFQPRRLLVVENADPFVTRFRSLLEKRVGTIPKTAILVLEVKTWPANTRLAKMVPDAATITCKAPPAYKTPPWCVELAASRYQKQLSSQAASLLVDLVGPDLGLLDQEILKLAIYVGEKSRIEMEDIDRLVGHSRAENTWKIFDALAEGAPAEALKILDRLLDQGEEPMRILGAFSMQLRRLAQAGHLAVQGLPLGTALQKAGVPPFAIKNAEAQLRHLGRGRSLKLYDWLLELNLDLRGRSPLPERLLFERLLLRLARKNC